MSKKKFSDSPDGPRVTAHAPQAFYQYLYPIGFGFHDSVDVWVKAIHTCPSKMLLPLVVLQWMSAKVHVGALARGCHHEVS